MTAIFDAAIIGYGPTGVTLANLLGRAGLSVVVVEREPTPYDRPRAIGIDQESLRTLQGCGVSEPLRAHIQPFLGTRYLGLDGEPIKRLRPVPPPYRLGWPPNASFIQPELEAMLRAAVARRPEVEVLTGHLLFGLEEHGGQVYLDVEPVGGGPRRTLQARYVVGCDGASSVVRRFIGSAVEDLDFDEWWVVIDALLHDPAGVPPLGCHWCWPSRPVSYVVGPRNLRRFEFKLLPGEDPAAFQDRNRIIDALSRHVDPAAFEIWRTAVYRFHAIVAHEWSRGRVFIAGDAAHQMPPFLGQGMNSGIRDAANIAWKLAAVLQGGAHAALLATYEQERKPHVRAVTARAKAIGLVIGELDPEAALRRDVALRAEMASGEAIEIRQAYIPPLTGGLLSASPAAGQLFVQPRLRGANGEEDWLDDVTGSRFLIATSEPGVLDWLDQATRPLWEAVGGRHVLIRPGCASSHVNSETSIVAAEVGTVFAEWMLALGCSAVLVRPDHYVFGTARTAEQLRALVRDVAGHVLRGETPAVSHAERQRERTTS